MVSGDRHILIQCKEYINTIKHGCRNPTQEPHPTLQRCHLLTHFWQKLFLWIGFILRVLGERKDGIEYYLYCSRAYGLQSQMRVLLC